ncbi:Conserved hypothetical protein, putative ATPase involved in DNA repair [Herminiimonas arsenicoxydans]|uniref:Lipoprotein n=1 Tax=Herminiimonas arsenicoxydans TaxID=204773 RepID=A4G7H9_HERAR|nr:Conserved hypothetical protein, putative ATPase involved in DNA repair [Herminiimonas arsenicoxydans]
MKNIRYPLLAFCFLFITGCDRNEMNVPKTKPVGEQSSSPNTAEKDREQKNQFLKATREELDRLQQDLDALKAKAANTSEAAKAKIDSEIQDLQKQQQVLETKWKAFQEEGSNAWRAVEKSFKESIENLRSAIRKITPNKG